MSLPVTRPTGRALLVSNPASRVEVRQTLDRLGYACADADDPYAAMAEFCRKPLAYRAIILSLAGLYREELTIIRAIKRRYPQAEVWLAHTDGRQAALAEAMRLGADGLLDDDGLHRIAISIPAAEGLLRVPAESAIPLDLPASATVPDPHAAPESTEEDLSPTEPLLSAEELRALLQEQPSMPPGGEHNGA
ncbi:MAG TPA: response regulator [Tepidisphaeraceae bacterium]|nr:response regulator [Tepidisphaeraceae bacterium]